MFVGRCVVSNVPVVSRVCGLRRVLRLTEDASGLGGRSSTVVAAFHNRRAVVTSTGNAEQLKTNYDAVVVGAG